MKEIKCYMLHVSLFTWINEFRISWAGFLSPPCVNDATVSGIYINTKYKKGLNFRAY